MCRYCLPFAAKKGSSRYGCHAWCDCMRRRNRAKAALHTGCNHANANNLAFSRSSSPAFTVSVQAQATCVIGKPAIALLLGGHATHTRPAGGGGAAVLPFRPILRAWPPVLLKIYLKKAIILFQGHQSINFVTFSHCRIGP